MTRSEIECPCCGGVGAVPDRDGLFYEGQSTLCGCAGLVRVEEGSVWVDAECPEGSCGAEAAGWQGPWPAFWSRRLRCYCAREGQSGEDEKKVGREEGRQEGAHEED